MPKVLQRLALSEANIDQGADDRTIDFVFSTSNIASDTHRIMPGAWQNRDWDGLSDFRANPVFLWAHNASQPAIGKVTNLIAGNDGTLRGSVQFATHEFAETIYQLYRGGFQRGASVSFEPIDWDYAQGPNRAPKALDFTRVKLWEISAVPLPADASALAAARSLGLDLTGVTTMPKSTAPEDAPTKGIEITKRGLYEVSYLASILSSLGWIKSWVDQEEAAEGDVDSTAPANMLAVLNTVGKTLVEMTQEEVNELIASFGPLAIDVSDVDDAGIIELAASRALRAQAKRMTRRLDREGRKLSKADGEELEDIHDHARRTRRLVRAAADACSDADMTDPDEREAVSDSLETACDHAEQTRSMVRGYIDARKTADPDENSPEATGDAATEERTRRASAKARKARLLTAPAA